MKRKTQAMASSATRRKRRILFLKSLGWSRTEAEADELAALLGVARTALPPDCYGETYICFTEGRNISESA